MNSGKPQNQSLAIAYAMKRKAKKMAEGGFIEDENASGFLDHEGNDVKHDGPAMAEDDRELGQHGEIEEGPQGAYAEGGFIGSHQGDEHDMDMIGKIMAMKQREFYHGGTVPMPGGAKGVEKAFGGHEDDSAPAKPAQSSESRPDPIYHQATSAPTPENSASPTDYFLKKQRSGMAKGGMAYSEGGQIGKIMRKSDKKHMPAMMSEGGRIANQDEIMAGFDPNEFDYLHLHDDDYEKADYTGANSGDEIGNAQEDKDQHDEIARIMRSRAKKDRLPTTR